MGVGLDSVTRGRDEEECRAEGIEGELRYRGVVQGWFRLI